MGRVRECVFVHGLVRQRKVLKHKIQAGSDDGEVINFAVGYVRAQGHAARRSRCPVPELFYGRKVPGFADGHAARYPNFYDTVGSGCRRGRGSEEQYISTRIQRHTIWCFLGSRDCCGTVRNPPSTRN